MSDDLEPLHQRLREAVDRGDTFVDVEGELLGPLDDALTALRGNPKHPFRDRTAYSGECKCGQEFDHASHFTDAGLPIEV